MIIITIKYSFKQPEDALLIEQNQFGYHFELGYKTMDSLSPNNFFLEIPRQENLFTKYFAFKGSFFQILSSLLLI